MLDKKTQDQVIAALSRVEGQVRGIAKMIENERYCIDTPEHRWSAAEAALHRAGTAILRGTSRPVLSKRFARDRRADTREKVEELLQVYARCRTK